MEHTWHWATDICEKCGAMRAEVLDNLRPLTCDGVRPKIVNAHGMQFQDKPIEHRPPGLRNF